MTPVCVFAYKRVDALRRTMSSLLQSSLAESTDLYIFSDGPADDKDREDVALVRNYIRQIKGFKSIHFYISAINKGLSRSVIEGVNFVLEKSEKIIVLEDDLVVSSNFLHYMNDALNYYETDERVISISGYTPPLKNPSNTNVYFTSRASSWGWATWKNRWVAIDWTVAEYAMFIKYPALQRKFNRMGSDLTSMLKKYKRGQNNSWAIRFAFHQFRHEKVSDFPMCSKVVNEGFDGNGTHTSPANGSRFFTPLDISGITSFNFVAPYTDPNLISQFLVPYRLQTRIFYKIKDLMWQTK